VNEQKAAEVAGPSPAACRPGHPWQRLAGIGTLAVVLPPWQSGHVNVVIIERARGKDSKLYPVGGNLPLAARAKAIRLAHNLVCRDRLPYRQAQRVMLEGYGLRRSLGQIFKDVRGYECPVCAEPPG
jgi:hypothetical protein